MRHASLAKRLAAAGVFVLIILAGCAPSDELSPPDPQGAAGTAGPIGGAGGTAAGGSGAGEAGTGQAGAGQAGGTGNTAGQGTAGGYARAGGASSAGTGGAMTARGGTGGGVTARGGTSGGGTSGTAGRGGASGTTGRGGMTATGGNLGTAGRGLQFVGNITTQNAVDTDGRVFSTYWDQISPENAGKWGSVQSSPGAGYNWRTLDAICGYTEQNGMLLR